MSEFSFCLGSCSISQKTVSVVHSEEADRDHVLVCVCVCGFWNTPGYETIPSASYNNNQIKKPIYQNQDQGPEKPFR